MIKLIAMIITLFLGGCLSNTEDDFFISESEPEHPDDVVLAPPGSADYSYFEAASFCQNHPYYDSNLLYSNKYVYHTGTTTPAFLYCVLPAIYYNMVGYSTDEVVEVRVYGRNANLAERIRVYLYSRGTYDISSASYGSRSIASTGAVESVYFSSPSIPWNDPYIILEVQLPTTTGDIHPQLHGFRVYYEE